MAHLPVTYLDSDDCDCADRMPESLEIIGPSVKCREVEMTHEALDLFFELAAAIAQQVQNVEAVSGDGDHPMKVMFEEEPLGMTRDIACVTFHSIVSHHLTRQWVGEDLSWDTLCFTNNTKDAFIRAVKTGTHRSSYCYAYKYWFTVTTVNGVATVDASDYYGSCQLN